jgi:hypothetical protein
MINRFKKFNENKNLICISCNVGVTVDLYEPNLNLDDSVYLRPPTSSFLGKSFSSFEDETSVYRQAL